MIAAMVDLKKIGSGFRISISDDMGHFVPITPVRMTAFEQGYTDLRFNGETMSWAYHKPDQAVGEDGRVYIKAGRS